MALERQKAERERWASPGLFCPLLVAASLLVLVLALGCSAGPPVLCAEGLADGGCSYHVEVHCGDVALCSAGSTQVLDAGSCVRDHAADVIDCT